MLLEAAIVRSPLMSSFPGELPGERVATEPLTPPIVTSAFTTPDPASNPESISIGPFAGTVNVPSTTVDPLFWL